GGVENANARAPDVGSGAVAFDERNDRIGRNAEAAVLERNRSRHRSSFRSAHLSLHRDFRERCGKLCGKASSFTLLSRGVSNDLAVCTTAGRVNRPPKSPRPEPTDYTVATGRQGASHLCIA